MPEVRNYGLAAPLRPSINAEPCAQARKASTGGTADAGSKSVHHHAQPHQRRPRPCGWRNPTGPGVRSDPCRHGRGSSPADRHTPPGHSRSGTSGRASAIWGIGINEGPSKSRRPCRPPRAAAGAHARPVAPLRTGYLPGGRRGETVDKDGGGVRGAVTERLEARRTVGRSLWLLADRWGVRAGPCRLRARWAGGAAAGEGISLTRGLNAKKAAPQGAALFPGCAAFRRRAGS